jgi:hypothetical protein
VLSQFLMGQPVGTGLAADEIGARLQGPTILVGQIREDRPEAPSQPIALDSMAHASSDGECEPGRERTTFEDRASVALRGGRDRRPGGFGGVREEGDPDRSLPGPDPVPAERHEGGPIADAPDQADSLWRPFNRRARITARPPRVDMRFRNPCFFARFRTLGWNVRFTGNLLDPAEPIRGAA